MKKNIFLIMLIATITSNCSKEYDYPKSIEEERMERPGSFFDINGKVFKKEKITAEKEETPKNTEILAKRDKITSKKQDYWQAALSVVSSKKIHFTDFAGGVIVTDWYQENESNNKKYKLVIMIDAENSNFEPILKVVVHEQEKMASVWTDTLNNKGIAEKIRKEIIRLVKNK